MQQQTCNRKGKESPSYLDRQMVTRTQIHLSQKEVVAYFVKAMKHFKDKELLIISFNTGNHINFYHVRPGLVLCLFKVDRFKNWRPTYP
jgi:hypothetical protein